MSGIACIFHTDGRPASRKALAAMTAAMDYRGPDGIDHYVNGAIALGQCTMHTTAESREASLPLANAQGTRVIVMDGYLTNRDDLRVELLQHGVQLRNRSDAELVLCAYETWGEDCPRHIDGEFAFIVWDVHAQRVFSARDHKGLRPLYCCVEQGRIVMGSDIAAIMVGIEHQPELNAGLLAEILVESRFTENETVWQGIMRVPSAHYMWLGRGCENAKRYWSPILDSRLPNRSDEDWLEEYREVFRDAVRQAARTHRPLACDVSGGLDSSAVFCMADRLQAEGHLPAPGLKGYALAGPDGTDADEIAFVRAVAAHLSHPITERPLFTPPLSWFDQFVRDNATTPPLPNLAMSIHLEEAARADGCRVRLNGIGGDEWLGGSSFAYEEALRQVDPRQLVKLLNDDLAQVGFAHTARLFLGCGVAPLLPPWLRRAINWARGRSNNADPPSTLPTPPMARELDKRRRAYEKGLPTIGLLRSRQDKLDPAFYAGIHDALALQMAHHQLEPRYPFLNRKFIEFSLAAPERLKQVRGVPKSLHRRAVFDLLPLRIIERKDKAEFSVAYARLDGDLARMAAEPVPSPFQAIANVAAARNAIKRYCAATIDTRSTVDVWGIYVVHVMSRYHQSSKGRNP